MADDLATITQRVEGIRNDHSKPDKRLADNMLDLNPVTTTALIQLTQGGMEPDRRGNLVNSRLRYFDPARKRAGLPEDVAALVSEMSDTGTVVTLVNLNTTTPRTLVVQGGAYGEHVIESVDCERQDHRGRQAEFQRDAEPWSRQQADAEDEALQRRRDGQIPLSEFRTQRAPEDPVSFSFLRLYVKIRTDCLA